MVNISFEQFTKFPLEFVKGFLLLRDELIKLNLYNLIEQSILNWFLDHSF